jgi:hypothetical protein
MAMAKVGDERLMPFNDRLRARPCDDREMHVGTLMHIRVGLRHHLGYAQRDRNCTLGAGERGKSLNGFDNHIADLPPFESNGRRTVRVRTQT